jgi:outer membrane biosynthesis protein TonB
MRPSSLTRPMPRALAALAVVAALLGAGCASDNRRLIPEDDAEDLKATVEQIATSAAEGDCDAARRQVQDAKQQVTTLDRSVARGLRTDLTNWLDHIEQRLPRDCEEQQEEEPEETQTPNPTPAETETATPAPTETATAVPTEVPTEAPTEAPTESGTGGADPGSGNGNGNGNAFGQEGEG